MPPAAAAAAAAAPATATPLDARCKRASLCCGGRSCGVCGCCGGVHFWVPRRRWRQHAPRLHVHASRPSTLAACAAHACCRLQAILAAVRTKPEPARCVLVSATMTKAVRKLIGALPGWLGGSWQRNAFPAGAAGADIHAARCATPSSPCPPLTPYGFSV